MSCAVSPSRTGVDRPLEIKSSFYVRPDEFRRPSRPLVDVTVGAGAGVIEFATKRRTLDVHGRYPGLRIQVADHTDATGPDTYNQRLSESRAASVVDYLVRRGIERTRLSSTGYGETRPIASNATATERTLNRRVEFVVVSPEAAVRKSRRVRAAE